jgi:DNA-binding response OmpR family regulator
MDSPCHVIVVHHAPLVVEAIDMVLSVQGFTVHPAATFGHAEALLRLLGTDIAAVITHGDMPTEPSPGTLLRMVQSTHPEAALVVLSGRPRRDIGPLPRKAVLLREPFDRADLLAAIVTACDPRHPPRSGGFAAPLDL